MRPIFCYLPHWLRWTYTEDAVRTENWAGGGGGRGAVWMVYGEHPLFRYCKECGRKQVVLSTMEQDGSHAFIGYENIDNAVAEDEFRKRVKPWPFPEPDEVKESRQRRAESDRICEELGIKSGWPKREAA